jgi:hypothetical protein
MTGVGGFAVSMGASPEREWAERFAAHIISAAPSAPEERRMRIARFRQHVARAVEPYFADLKPDSPGRAASAVRTAFVDSEWGPLFAGERVAEVHFWLEHFMREATADASAKTGA